MTIIEILSEPTLYYMFSGLLVSMIYQLSRKTFRNNKMAFWIYSLVSIITAGILLVFYQVALSVFLFIPIFSTALILALEKTFNKKYEYELPETAFWYLTGETKSEVNNRWNTIIGLTTFVLPMALCIFAQIFIKF